MGKFGAVAVKATRLLISKEASNPREAWDIAAQILDCSPDMKRKGCPRGAYLGLCDAGLVKGAPTPRGRPWTRSVDNKRYAIRAVEALLRDETLRCRPADLWREASQPRTIVHNGQLDVVLGLWAEQLISN